MFPKPKHSLRRFILVAAGFSLSIGGAYGTNATAYGQHFDPNFIHGQETGGWQLNAPTMPAPQFANPTQPSVQFTPHAPTPGVPLEPWVFPLSSVPTRLLESNAAPTSIQPAFELPGERPVVINEDPVLGHEVIGNEVISGEMLSNEVPLSEVPATMGEVYPSNMSSVPEGYDPAYPVEYPGDDFKGYYPTDAGVVARPSDAPLASSETADNVASGNAVSDDTNMPTIPNEVIGGGDVLESANATNEPDSTPAETGGAAETDVNSPEAKPVEPPEMGQETVDLIQSTEQETQANTTDPAELEAAEISTADAEKSNSANATDNAKAAAERAAEQSVAAALLRAKEAEEKAAAIAAKFDETQDEMKSLQSELDSAKARVSEKEMGAEAIEKQLATMRMKLEKAQSDAAAEKDARAKAEAAAKKAKNMMARARKNAAAVKSELKATNARLAEKEAAQREQMKQLKPNLALQPKAGKAADATNGLADQLTENPIRLSAPAKTADTANPVDAKSNPDAAALKTKGDEPIAEPTKPKRRLTVREQVRALEIERDNALKASSKSIRKDFMAKIDKKLDEWATLRSGPTAVVVLTPTQVQTAT